MRSTLRTCTAATVLALGFTAAVFAAHSGDRALPPQPEQSRASSLTASLPAGADAIAHPALQAPVQTTPGGAMNDNAMRLATPALYTGAEDLFVLGARNGGWELRRIPTGIYTF